MPNWCMNDLNIIGDPQELRRIKRFLKGPDSELDFEKVIPIPENITSNSDVIALWGTKWNASDVTVSMSRDLLSYGFSTAWSPPAPIIAKLGTMFPNVTFELKYEEPGMRFRGTFSAQGEDISDEQENDYEVCEECGNAVEQCDCEGGPTIEGENAGKKKKKKDEAEAFEKQWEKVSFPNLDYKVLKASLNKKALMLDSNDFIFGPYWDRDWVNDMFVEMDGFNRRLRNSEFKSFKHHAEGLEYLSNSDDLREAADYWVKITRAEEKEKEKKKKQDEAENFEKSWEKRSQIIVEATADMIL